jgi:hypothetical protein
VNHVLVGHDYADLTTWPPNPAERAFTFDDPGKPRLLDIGHRV